LNKVGMPKTNSVHLAVSIERHLTMGDRNRATANTRLA